MSAAAVGAAGVSPSPPLDTAARELVLKLLSIGAFKFGEFTLKSGVVSPVYVDLRVIVSHPQVLSAVADALINVTRDVEHHTLCGVPYTALPFATLMGFKTNKPMLMKRKQVKKYGTKKMIEGDVVPGQKCMIVEDLVTSGLSVFETVQPLEEAGLVVEDVVVLLDRTQGGRANVEGRGKRLHSVMTLPQVLHVLHEAGSVDGETVASVHRFLADNQVAVSADLKASVVPPSQTPTSDTATSTPAAKRSKPAPAPTLALAQPSTYQARAATMPNAAGRTLLETMVRKSSNLCLAADVRTAAELLALAEACGPAICCLKTHADAVDNWTQETAQQLVALGQKHDFVIFEDRKFADIGNTVVKQCADGHYGIAKWAGIINAHPLPGPGIVEGLRRAMPDKTGLLLIAQMSSKGCLITPEYASASLGMARAHADFVCGFICQERLDMSASGDDFVYMTPGVKLHAGTDDLGQQYKTPHSVIVEKACDVIIVGRGIYASADPASAAKEFKAAGWAAYEQRQRA